MPKNRHSPLALSIESALMPLNMIEAEHDQHEATSSPKEDISVEQLQRAISECREELSSLVRQSTQMQSNAIALLRKLETTEQELFSFKGSRMREKGTLDTISDFTENEFADLYEEYERLNREFRMPEPDASGKRFPSERTKLVGLRLMQLCKVLPDKSITEFMIDHDIDQGTRARWKNACHIRDFNTSIVVPPKEEDTKNKQAEDDEVDTEVEETGDDTVDEKQPTTLAPIPDTEKLFTREEETSHDETNEDDKHPSDEIAEMQPRTLGECISLLEPTSLDRTDILQYQTVMEALVNKHAVTIVSALWDKGEMDVQDLRAAAIGEENKHKQVGVMFKLTKAECIQSRKEGRKSIYRLTEKFKSDLPGILAYVASVPSRTDLIIVRKFREKCEQELLSLPEIASGAKLSDTDVELPDEIEEGEDLTPALLAAISDAAQWEASRTEGDDQVCTREEDDETYTPSNEHVDDHEAELRPTENDTNEEHNAKLKEELNRLEARFEMPARRERMMEEMKLIGLRIIQIRKLLPGYSVRQFIDSHDRVYATSEYRWMKACGIKDLSEPIVIESANDSEESSDDPSPRESEGVDSKQEDSTHSSKTEDDDDNQEKDDSTLAVVPTEEPSQNLKRSTGTSPTLKPRKRKTNSSDPQKQNRVNSSDVEKIAQAESFFPKKPVKITLPKKSTASDVSAFERRAKDGRTRAERLRIVNEIVAEHDASKKYKFVVVKIQPLTKRTTGHNCT